MIWRVRDRASFAALADSAWRVRRGPITVTLAVGGAGRDACVAYMVGRRVGGAVERNRLRRRLRAIVTQVGPSSGLYLIGARPSATRLSFTELRDVVSVAMSAAEMMSRSSATPTSATPSWRRVL